MKFCLRTSLALQNILLWFPRYWFYFSLTLPSYYWLKLSSTVNQSTQGIWISRYLLLSLITWNNLNTGGASFWVVDSIPNPNNFLFQSLSGSAPIRRLVDRRNPNPLCMFRDSRVWVSRAVPSRVLADRRNPNPFHRFRGSRDWVCKDGVVSGCEVVGGRWGGGTSRVWASVSSSFASSSFTFLFFAFFFASTFSCFLNAFSKCSQSFPEVITSSEFSKSPISQATVSQMKSFKERRNAHSGTALPSSSRNF